MFSPERRNLLIPILGVLAAGGTTVAVLQFTPRADGEIFKPKATLPTPEPKNWSSVSRPIGGRQIGLVSVIFQTKGLSMFTPSLEIQAAQAGGELISVDPTPRIIPIDRLGYLELRRPGPGMNVFLPFNTLDRTKREYSTVMSVEVYDPRRDIHERYYLLTEPGEAYEMTSTEQTRQMLPYFPAALDIRTVIVFPEFKWVRERNPSEHPQKLPSTGRR